MHKPLALLLLCLSVPTAFAQEREVHAGMTAYFGSLHAHSVHSADVGHDGGGLAPLALYAAAREAGLDFIGISDHHKGVTIVDGVPRVRGGKKFLLHETMYAHLVQSAQTFNAENAGSFVALAGIEWGTIGTGNHVNVFGAPNLPPSSIHDEDYDELYTWIAAHATFAQFNHPYSWGGASNRNIEVGNFGEALFVDEADFVAAADVVSLMSIITTVHGGHITGEHHESTEKTHRDSHEKALPAFRSFLNKGFHLSPAANQDTHGNNPGSVTAARTGVWATELTELAIIEAIRANRVFATEDDELAVALQVERADGRLQWMGETVRLDADTEDVTLLLHVGQAAGVDGDARDEGPYVVTLYRDRGGPGGVTARKGDEYALSSAGDWIIDTEVRAGEYLYVQVREEGGSDNPIGDGRAITLDDDAWTSPVWFSR